MSLFNSLLLATLWTLVYSLSDEELSLTDFFASKRKGYLVHIVENSKCCDPYISWFDWIIWYLGKREQKFENVEKPFWNSHTMNLRRNITSLYQYNKCIQIAIYKTPMAQLEKNFMHLKAVLYSKIFMCYNKTTKTMYGHPLLFKTNHRHSSELNRKQLS